MEKELEQELQALRLQGAASEGLLDELQSLEKEKTDLQRSVNEERLKVLKLERQLKEFRQLNLVNSGDKLNELQNELFTAIQKIDQQLRIIHLLEKDKEALGKTLDTEKTKVSKLEGHLLKARQIFAEHNSKVAEFQEQINDANRKIQQYLAEIEKLESDKIALKRQIQHHKDNILKNNNKAKLNIFRLFAVIVLVFAIVVVALLHQAWNEKNSIEESLAFEQKQREMAQTNLKQLEPAAEALNKFLDKLSYCGWGANCFVGYSPDLNAVVAPLKFFEGGKEVPKLKERKYLAKFPKDSSRFIYWEAYMIHSTPKRKDFSIEHVYTKADNLTTVSNSKVKGYILPEWNASFHVYAGGWEEPAHWEIGKYKVELFIEKTKIAEGEFEVY